MSESQKKENGFALKRPRFLNNLTLFLFALLAIAETIVQLNAWKVVSIPATYTRGARLLVIAMISLLVVRLILKYTEGRIFRFLAEDLELEHRIFLAKLYRFALHFAAGLFIMNQLGVSLQSLSISVGLLATGFALAIREAIVSYIAWFIILAKKPFRIGDVIGFEGRMGEVSKIGTFFTTLHCFDSMTQFVKVPNQLFLSRIAANYGTGQPIPEQTILPLPATPADAPEFLAAVERLIESQPAASGPTAVNLEVSGTSLQLVIDYQVDYKQSAALRTALLTELLRLREEHVPAVSAGTPPAAGAADSSGKPPAPAT